MIDAFPITHSSYAFLRILRRPADAGGAELLVVALLEEEALVVGLDGVVDGVHGPVVAVVEEAALVVAGEGVGHVEVVHVHDVVQGGAAGVVAVDAAVDRGVSGAWEESNVNGPFVLVFLRV